MIAITRFDRDMDGYMSAELDGSWVRYDSHDKVVSELNEQMFKQSTEAANEFNLHHEAVLSVMSAIEQLEETIAQQADRIVELNKECNSHYETCQQLAEAIRLKDEALLNLLSVIDSEAYPTIQNNGYDAVAIQPSPEILQDRDKRVAEACAKVCIEQAEGIARSTPVSRDRVHTLVENTMFKGTARPATVIDCSESSVRESAFRIRNGAWERHL